MPRRGELWWVDLDPVVGRELGGKVRPAVIVSDDEMNRSLLEKVIAVPSTSQPHDVRWRVPWKVRTTRGVNRAYFCCDDVRSVSVERLRGRIGTGVLPLDVMSEIEQVLRALLALYP